MTILGLPTEMFWIFVATVLAGSLGAIHYVVAHVILGRPFAEIPPPVLRDGEGLEAPGAGAERDAGDPGGGGGEGARGAEGRGEAEGADG